MTSEEGPTRVSARRRLGVGAAIVVVLAALAATVAIGVVRGALTPSEAVAPAADAAPSPTAARLYVDVAGAVRVPGLYALPAGARLVDAVAAAGGFAQGADRQAVNLARPVSDGEQILVSVLGAAPGTGPAGATAAPGDGRVNLNTADEAALDTLPRIGPAMAKRIVQWRDDNGRFTSVEDLLAVPGIGDKMLDALRELVTV
ncbi:MAG: ComEA family DNA-binding protein [Microbacterium sp.]|uniref:ComEA family DNA-binding protein n=1 Tax=Microbacterium sp. TaxID=51671 RepID=UPI001AC0E1E6|nr:ComEA family DNA-binding protein [Microbacterium sp.]MBN9152801.1 ComEA family DNA-binding protein [Microbacterium sp.]